jgi:hypothetical protein
LKNDLLTELCIGCLMGIVAYLVIQSRSLPKILHPSIDVTAIPDTNVFIAALVCFVAGLFSGDLIDTAEKRLRQISGTPKKQKKQQQP